MDLQQVIDALAALDPDELTEDDRAALVGGVRRVVGRRALVGPAEALPAGALPAHHGALVRAAPHHPALRRRGAARPVLRLVPGPA